MRLCEEENCEEEEIENGRVLFFLFFFNGIVEKGRDGIRVAEPKWLTYSS